MSLTGAGLVSLFLVVAEAFLTIRFVLEFFANDPNGGFASWVMHSTDGLLSPFRGVFTAAVPGHPHMVDLPLLFIMAAYAVVASLLTLLLGWATTDRVAIRKK
jgi:hypothetical protein